jgi:hypothetical protein
MDSMIKCSVFSSLFHSEPPDLLPLTFGRDVMDEGGFAQVSCIVTKGDQPLTISWSFHGHNISSDLGIITTPIGRQGSMLMIPSVGHKHRGTYTCKASNSAGVRTETVELRVNGIYLRHGPERHTQYFLSNFSSSSSSPGHPTRVIWPSSSQRGWFCPSVLHRN